MLLCLVDLISTAPHRCSREADGGVRWVRASGLSPPFYLLSCSHADPCKASQGTEDVSNQPWHPTGKCAGRSVSRSIPEDASDELATRRCGVQVAGQPREHVLQIGPRVMTMHLCRPQSRGSGLPSCIASCIWVMSNSLKLWARRSAAGFRLTQKYRACNAAPLRRRWPGLQPCQRATRPSCRPTQRAATERKRLRRHLIFTMRL